MAKRSITSRIQKRITPMSESRTSAANIVGSSKFPMERCSTKPRPELEPTNSPTTAPTTASVIDTFRPEKIAGIACGRLTAQNTRKRLPCIAREGDHIGVDRLKASYGADPHSKEPKSKRREHFWSVTKSDDP